MDNDTIKIIQERFDSLPQNIQAEIMSPHYAETLKNIGEAYNMNRDTLNVLEREVTLLMMGLTPLTAFKGQLTQELNIPEEQAIKIVEDLYNEIFFNYADLLELMNSVTHEDPSKNLEKDMNFILSGGDYSAFLEKEHDQNERELILPSTEDMKDGHLN